MLRRHHRFFQSLQVIRDAVVVALAFYLAHLARFSFPELMPYESVSPARETLAVGMMLVATWPVVAWASGLYVSRRTRSFWAEVFDVFRVTVLAFLVLVTITYFARDVRFSRGTLILWAGFNVVVVSAARIRARAVMHRLRQQGYNLRHVVVVGTGELAANVLGTIREQVRLGLRAVGVVAHSQSKALVGENIQHTPVLGTVDELESILESHGVDQVIVALPIDKLDALAPIMEVLSRQTVDVRLVPDFYQYMTLCGSVDEFSGLPIINLQATPLVGWNSVLKRAFDVVAAGVGMLIAGPLMAAIALLIRLTSPGPVLFRQERVGMDGRRFSMVKFRTMRVDAEAHGARMTVPGDPRRTRIGTILRKTSLDELPQLWNVLRGEMSLVGPRPEQPCFIESFKKEIPRYALRHKIKAGMTGWAQVNGMRGDTSIEKRIEFDLYYIENWSLLLDIKIILRTVFGGFISPNAY